MRLSTDSHILSSLLDRGQMTTAELSIQADRHPSVVHRCLVNLERIGMVERTRAHKSNGHIYDSWGVGKRVREARK